MFKNDIYKYEANPKLYILFAFMKHGRSINFDIIVLQISSVMKIIYIRYFKNALYI